MRTKKNLLFLLCVPITMYSMNSEKTLPQETLNNKLLVQILPDQAPNTKAIRSLLVAKADPNVQHKQTQYHALNILLYRYYKVKELCKFSSKNNFNHELYSSKLLLESAISLLLDFNADSSIQNDLGESSLYIAIRHYDDILCKKLLAPLQKKEFIFSKEYPTLQSVLARKNNTNETAFDVATRLYNQETKKLESLNTLHKINKDTDTTKNNIKKLKIIQNIVNPDNY